MENLQAEEAVTIVRKILTPGVDPQKITYNQMKGYVAIMFESDRYRTICRLYLNNQRRKYIGILSKNKVETRYRIEVLTDIFNHSEDISAIVSLYEA